MTRLLFLMVPSFVLAVMGNGANAADGCSPGAPISVSLTPAAVVTCCGTQYTISLDAYDNDDCNAPPFKDYLAIAGWPGPAPVRGEDGHYRATLTRSHAQPGDYSFTVTVSDNTTTHYANDPADASARVDIQALSVQSCCVSPVPLPQSRTVIGVGEQVVCTVNGNACWSVSGSGTLNEYYGSSTTLTAGGSGGTVTVYSAIGGAGCSKTFQVIEPNAISLTVAYPDYIVHQQYTASVGYLACMTLLPSSVSFGALEIQEQECPYTTCTGHFACIDHPLGQWVPVLPTNDVDGHDQIQTGTYFEPFQESRFRWEIPVHYRKKQTSTSFEVCTLVQDLEIDSAGTATAIKGFSAASRPSDAPTQILWGPPE